MNSQKQDPIKKLNKTKATSQLKSFFETNGYDLENPVVKGKIESAISDPDNFERNVRSIYSRYYEGSQPLNFDSIFESMYDIQEAPMQPFVNEVESEKKKTTETEDVTGSASTSALETPSLGLSYDLDKKFVTPSNVFSKVVNSLTTDVLSEDPKETVKYLNNKLGNYGFQFDIDKGAFGSEIVVSDDKGNKTPFRLYEEGTAYTGVMLEDSVEGRKKNKLTELKDFLLSNQDPQLPFTVNLFRNIPLGKFLPTVEQVLSDSFDILKPDLEDVARKYNDVAGIEGYLKGGKVDIVKSINTLTALRDKVAEKDYIPERVKAMGPLAVKKYDRKSELKVIDEMLSDIEKARFESSAVLGNILSESGAYKNIDYSDPLHIKVYSDLGLFPEDLPLESIIIDGKPSSLNEVYNILYDFEKADDIRDGIGHDIQIKDASLSGLLASEIPKVENTIKVQRATKSELADIPIIGSTLRAVENQFYRMKDFGVTQLVSAMDVVKDLGIIYNHALRNGGLSQEEADLVVYGNLPIMNWKGFKPEYIDSLRDNYIPKMSGSYTEDWSKGWSNFISERTLERASDDLSNNFLHTATFILNPILGLGLQFIKDTGEKMQAYDYQMAALREKERSGLRLSADERLYMERPQILTDIAILGNSSKNAGLTYLFVGKFLLKLRGLWQASKAATGTTQAAKEAAKNVNVRDVFNLYAKYQAGSLVNRVGAVLRTPVSLTVREQAEEQLIALSDYMFDSYMGHRKWNFSTALDQMGNVGVSTLVNSLAMGVGTNVYQRSTANNYADGIMSNFIVFPKEIESIERSADLKNKINKFKETAESQGIDPENSDVYNSYKKEKEAVDQEYLNLVKDKSKFVDRMKRGQKIDFLYHLSNLEQSYQSLKESTDLDVIDRANKNIEESKQAMRDILKNVDSEVAFHFASEKTRNELAALAAISIKYTPKEGEELTYNSLRNNAEVMAAAEKIYQKRIRDKNVREADDIDYADGEYFGAKGRNKTDAIEEYNEVGSIDVFDNLKSLLNLAFERVKFDGGNFTLDDVIGRPNDEFKSNLKDIENELFEIYLRIEDLAQENFGIMEQMAEIADILDSDQDLDPETVAKYQETLRVLDKQVDEIQSEYDLLTAEFDGFKTLEATELGIEAAFRINNILGNRTKSQETIDRRKTIFNKIDRIGRENFIESLSKTDQAIFERFLEDYNRTGEAKLGAVEAMIEAQERINQIKSNAGGKIRLSNKKDGQDVVEGLKSKGINILKKIYNAGEVRQLGNAKLGLSTTDVLAKFLFRDTNVGKPFYEQYQNLTRKFSVASKQASDIQESHRKEYRKDFGRFKSLYDAKSDPNSRYNSFEMYMLAYLRREVLQDPNDMPFAPQDVDEDTADATETTDKLAKRSKGMGIDYTMFQKSEEATNEEFFRVKDLLLQKGELLRTAAMEKGASGFAVKASRVYDQVLSDLGINEAQSFQEVAEKANKRNLNAVERMASLYDSDDYIQRIEDWEDHKPTIYKKGTYIPMLMDVQGQTISDFNKDPGRALSGSLEATTRPKNLVKGEVDLNMDMFFQNIYGQYRAHRIDLDTNKDKEVFHSMVSSPSFEAIFEDADTRYGQNLLNAFRNIKTGIDQEIRNSNAKVIDVEKATRFDFAEFGGDFESTMHSLVAAKVLSKASQNLNQFTSAMFATMPLLKTKRARRGMATRFAAFPFFLARSFDGTNQGMLSSYLNRVSGLQDALAKEGRMSNIFALSRTAARNSVFAEAGVMQGKKMPMDYYLTSLGVDYSKNKVLQEIISREAKYTVDQAFNIINGLANVSMEVFLANGDRIASNTAFEHLYMDYRIHNQGAEIKGKLSDWWAQENANPNIEAINYADSNIAELMKQTESFTDADIYRPDAPTGTRVAARMLLPYGRFIVQAKSTITANLAIMNDPNVDPEQRDMAKRKIISRVLEVVTYNGIKQMTNLSFVTGQLLPMLVLDDDDIERYGRYSITGLIGSEMLPIESREDFQVSGVSFEDAESKEQYNAIYQNTQNAMKGLKEISTIAEDYNNIAMEYENKFSSGSRYSVVQSTLQDLAFSIQPLPIPDQVLELIGAKFNSLYGEDVFLEFMSEDLKDLDTQQQWMSLIAENLGSYSLILETAAELMRADDIYEDLTIKKSMGETGGTTKLYLTAPNDKMREKLLIATELLQNMRYSALFIPGFKGDFDRLADRLERSIEKHFTQSKPDTRLIQMAEMKRMRLKPSEVTPMQEEGYEPVKKVLPGGDVIQQYPVPIRQVLPQGPKNQMIQTTDEIKPVEPETTELPKPRKIEINPETIGFKFEKAQGSLELPVEGAVIKEKQGLLKDPEYSRDVVTMNRGIVLETNTGDQVKSVFDGVVTDVLSTKQGKMGVIVNHGDYTTTYFGISDLNVQKGDTIPKGTVLGRMFGKEGGKSDLKFYIYKDQYMLNPEEWIKKTKVKESNKVRVQINQDMLDQIKEMNDPNQVNELFNQASQG